MGIPVGSLRDRGRGRGVSQWDPGPVLAVGGTSWVSVHHGLERAHTREIPLLRPHSLGQWEAKAQWVVLSLRV